MTYINLTNDVYGLDYGTTNSRFAYINEIGYKNYGIR